MPADNSYTNEYTDAVSTGLDGMRGVSSGTCPGCTECMDIDGYTDEDKHREDWRTYDMPSGGEGFSWRPCGVCKTALGGNRHVWHWIDGGDEHGKGGEIVHESDMCTDCVLYLANGDEPEAWSKH